LASISKPLKVGESGDSDGMTVARDESAEEQACDGRNSDAVREMVVPWVGMIRTE